MSFRVTEADPARISTARWAGVRTTQAAHHRAVTALLQMMAAAGDPYVVAVTEDGVTWADSPASAAWRRAQWAAEPALPVVVGAALERDEAPCVLIGSDGLQITADPPLLGACALGRVDMAALHRAADQALRAQREFLRARAAASAAHATEDDELLVSLLQSWEILGVRVHVAGDTLNARLSDLDGLQAVPRAAAPTDIGFDAIGALLRRAEHLLGQCRAEYVHSVWIDSTGAVWLQDADGAVIAVER